MVPTFLADTWFLIATIDRFDSHHRQAGRLRDSIGSSQIVTHDAVLTEALAFFSGQGARARAEAAFVIRSALTSYEVVPVDRGLFLLGVDLYAARPDKEYSLVDCMSMVLMKERGITHVLTNDHHFRQEGFVVLSE